MTQTALDANRIWDEYKYRHEHCWATTFKLTAAVVTISAAPYTSEAVAGKLGGWIVLLPFVAIALSLFGLLRMEKELKILDTIRMLHRDSLRAVASFERSTFTWHARIYLVALCVAAAVNVYMVAWIWTPALQSGGLRATYKQVCVRFAAANMAQGGTEANNRITLRCNSLRSLFSSEANKADFPDPFCTTLSK